MTPVEATATRSCSTPTAAAAAACIRSATSMPWVPVAALALPALTTSARSARISERSCVTSTGAASTPERVNRAALVVSGASLTSRPTSVAPEGLMPAATPAARKPAGSPGDAASRTPSGTSSHRERKKLTRSPSSRRSRT